jgi:hypothetical protein
MNRRASSTVSYAHQFLPHETHANTKKTHDGFSYNRSQTPAHQVLPHETLANTNHFGLISIHATHVPRTTHT